MGKTIILNLSGVKLSGDVLDVGESYGVIYNISKDAIDEVSIDLLEGDIDEKKVTQKYDTCTIFFYLSNLWMESSRADLIKEVNKLIKVGGEIYIWDINKEMGEISNNKVMTVLLDKLPYKRIPTDRDRYQAPGINSETPVVLDFQVEQPRNTAYSLKGVSVL